MARQSRGRQLLNEIEALVVELPPEDREQCRETLEWLRDLSPRKLNEMAPKILPLIKLTAALRKALDRESREHRELREDTNELTDVAIELRCVTFDRDCLKRELEQLRRGGNGS